MGRRAANKTNVVGPQPARAWLGGAALAVATAALSASVLAGGCVAIADIGDIEFGTTAPSSTSTAGGHGGSGGNAGGTGGVGAIGAGGAGGAQGGSGGAAPSCTDDTQNGEETGIDCGGPECDPCSEDCTNGVDDDGNELVDCADPLCSGYACAPQVPENWAGPLAFYLGTETAPAGCGPSFESMLAANSTLVAPAASCSCGCGAPSGGSCGLPTISLWDPDDCSGTPNATVNISASGACDETGASTIDSARSSTIPVTGASCSPSSDVQVSPPSWTESALLCGGATTGAGCSESGASCVRQLPSPFDPNFCISRQGDEACPAGAYTTRYLVHQSLSDDRDCTTCGCGSPSGMTCTGNTRVYQQPGCAGQSAALTHDGATCVGGNAARSVRYTYASGPSGGACSPTGGAPTGAAVATEPVTVCCVP